MERRPLFRIPQNSRGKENCTDQLDKPVLLGPLTTENTSYDLLRKDHEKAEFEVHEVYAVDVLISSGEGKVKRE